MEDDNKSDEVPVETSAEQDGDGSSSVNYGIEEADMDHSNEKPSAEPVMEAQGEMPASVARNGYGEILKLLSGEVQLAGSGPWTAGGALPDDVDVVGEPSFAGLSERIVESVASANIELACKGELPFSTLYRLCGRRLSEELSDRRKRPAVLSEILAAQVRDNAIACEFLNSALYGMRDGDIQKSLAQGKGPLQNTLALRHKCEKAIHAAVETMNAVDEALYPQVTVRRKSSMKICRKGERSKVTMTGSTMQAVKNRQLH